MALNEDDQTEPTQTATEEQPKGTETATEAASQPDAEGAPEAQHDEGSDANGQKEDGRKNPWYLKRIGKLSAEKSELEERLARLEAERAALTAPQQSDDEPASPVGLSAADIERLADQKANQKLAAQAFDKACNTTYEAGTKKHGGAFAESVKQLGAAVGPQAFRGVLEIATELDAGSEVIYHLGNTPDEAARIASLPPLKQASELTRLEAKLTAPPPPKKLTASPPPVEPINGRGGKASVDLNDKSVPIDVWMREREKQVAERGRRR